MGYQGNDNRGDERWRNEDRWQDRERGYRAERDDRNRGEWNRNRGDGSGSYGRDNDRGFFERAGDEVRSWFGDDEAERRRERDQRFYERERGWDDGRRYSAARDSGESRGSDYGRGRGRGYDEDRGYRGGGGFAGGRAGGLAQGSWGGSEFGGTYDSGRRFDRVDAGSTGTHGAHPISAATGDFGPYGGGYDGGDYARSRAIYESSGRSGGHDPHYSQWRNRQIESLDRDYDDYRREHQSKFEEEFGSWREKRQTQRQALGRVREHMEVVGSDDEHLGTVDKVRGDRIILTKSDPNAGGHHHSIPCGWLDRVDDKVYLNKSADQARRAWTDEETSRALFEREDSGSDGPHALDRAFSGTY